MRSLWTTTRVVPASQLEKSPHTVTGQCNRINKQEREHSGLTGRKVSLVPLFERKRVKKGDALKQRKIMKKKKRNRKRKCIEVSLIYSNTVMQHITVLSERNVSSLKQHTHLLSHSFCGSWLFISGPHGAKIKVLASLYVSSQYDWARTCFKLRWFVAEISSGWPVVLRSSVSCYQQMPSSVLAGCRPRHLVLCHVGLPIQTLFHQCYWDGHYSMYSKIVEVTDCHLCNVLLVKAKYRTTHNKMEGITQLHQYQRQASTKAIFKVCPPQGAGNCRSPSSVALLWAQKKSLKPTSPKIPSPFLHLPNATFKT